MRTPRRARNGVRWRRPRGGHRRGDPGTPGTLKPRRLGGGGVAKRRRAARAFRQIPGPVMPARGAGAIAAGGVAGAIGPGDLAGTWSLRFTPPDGIEHTPTLVLSQDGGRLEGTLRQLDGQDLTAKEISLKGEELLFRVNGTHDG